MHAGTFHHAQRIVSCVSDTWSSWWSPETRADINSGSNWMKTARREAVSFCIREFSSFAHGSIGHWVTDILSLRDRLEIHALSARISHGDDRKVEKPGKIMQRVNGVHDMFFSRNMTKEQWWRFYRGSLYTSTQEEYERIRKAGF